MKLDKVISDLGTEERKILMEKLRKDESGEWKNTIDPIWVSFFNWEVDSLFKNILLTDMIQVWYC